MHLAFAETSTKIMLQLKVHNLHRLFTSLALYGNKINGNNKKNKLRSYV